ncbi:hypothetical protein CAUPRSCDRAFT_8110, partial [Caulochytrium protostelioides]
MSNEKRYDRQLRLWGGHGQAALESAHILLLNGSPLGTEILKNLILPGIQAFTVVDAQVVTRRDLGNNFFVTRDQLGQPRAAALASLLGELNEDVEAHSIQHDPWTFLTETPAAIAQYSVIIVADAPRSHQRAIEALALAHGVPVVIASVDGFIGFLQLAHREAAVLESHSDGAFDMRLDKPFPELDQFVAAYDLDALSPTERSYVPYLVLLAKALRQWRQAIGHAPEDAARLPATADERQALRAATEALRHPSSQDTENIEQALKAVFRASQPTTVPDTLTALFD